MPVAPNTNPIGKEENMRRVVTCAALLIVVAGFAGDRLDALLRLRHANMLAYGLLAAARPILFVGPADSEVARILRQSEAGIVVPPGDVILTAAAAAPSTGAVIASPAPPNATSRSG